VGQIPRHHEPNYVLWAFGARVRGSPKRYPGLDLAIISDAPLSWRVPARPSEDFVEYDSPWRADAVDWSTFSTTFRDRVAREHVVIHQPGQPPP
jgi:type I restriction enzyme S subunit